MKKTSSYDELSFVERRPDPGRWQTERCYFEYTVNRRPLPAILGLEGKPGPGVFGWQAAKVELSYARQLLLREPAALPSGRVPLYVCGQCGDLGCQSLAVRVTEYEECVVWSAFGWDDVNRPRPSHPNEIEGSFPDVRDFYFLRTEYEDALSRFSAGHRMRPPKG